MRATILATAAVFGLLMMPATSQAAPVTGHAVASGAAPLVLVRGGCGRGFHPAFWRDRFGRLHRQCVPNRRWGPPPRWYYR